jgi:hypothetical protein
MTIRIMDKANYHSVGMVISSNDSEYDDEEESNNQFCSTCAAVGELNKLKPRIYLDDKW